MVVLPSTFGSSGKCAWIGMARVGGRRAGVGGMCVQWWWPTVGPGSGPLQACTWLQRLEVSICVAAGVRAGCGHLKNSWWISGLGHCNGTGWVGFQGVG